MVSLLPPNSTDMERAIEHAGSLGHIDCPIDTISNPRTCAESFLPFLAWALSVDFWDETWTIDIKRQVVAAAWESHAYKGTVHGLEVALATLDLDTSVTQWFDYGGDPYKFKVDVDISSRGLSDNEQNIIQIVIENAKNTRSHLDTLNIHITTKGNAPSISCAICIGHDVSVYPLFIPDVEHHQTAPIYTLGTQMVQDVEIYPKVVL
jgi:phage tail P2-like protein